MKERCDFKKIHKFKAAILLYQSPLECNFLEIEKGTIVLLNCFAKRQKILDASDDATHGN